jgi:hypothetical protein
MNELEPYDIRFVEDELCGDYYVRDYCRSGANVDFGEAKAALDAQAALLAERDAEIRRLRAGLHEISEAWNSRTCDEDSLCRCTSCIARVALEIT